MKNILSTFIVVVILGIPAHAQTAPAAQELTQLLQEFLAGASHNDAAMHDRFWADDLIYTRSAGRRIGKADVLKDARSAPAPKPGDPKTTYSAEDIRIQQYGNTAVVAFRLVGETEKDGNTQIAHFLNTGTFVKRNGKWQVVAWQSTRMLRPEEEVKKEVARIEATFHKAILAADIKTLESVVDETFIWTHRTGEQATRQQLIEQLSSGRLKYIKLETKNVSIVIYGDAAVVRGISPRQRSAIPNSTETADAVPFDAFYTLTLANRGGSWKVVAMHTSRREP